VKQIYSGHDEPVLSGATKMIARTVECVRASTVVAANGEISEIQHPR
jgi:hypothetical protein